MKLQKLIKNNLKDKQFAIAISKFISLIYILSCALLIAIVCNFIKNPILSMVFMIISIITTSITSIKVTNIYFKLRNKLVND